MSAAVLPVNLQVPKDPTAPVVADFATHALRVALVHRRDVDALPPEWSQPGVYVLLAAMSEMSTTVYVGQAIDLRKRLMQHRNKPKLAWWRAVAVKRDTTHGFHSAEIGYLEGGVAAELAATAGITVVEGKKDQDSTLPGHQLLALDEFVPSVMAALRVSGVDLGTAAAGPETSSQVSSSKGKKAPNFVPGTVTDLVAAGLLPAGAALTFTTSGKTATAKVNASGDLIVDGVTYTSPSTAAAKAHGLKAVNGWTAWRTESGELLAELRTKLPPGTDTVDQ